jgi:hypothetical protein
MIAYKIKLWLGSGIFAFGIFWWVWFLRNLFKRRIQKAKLYTEYHPLIHIIWNSIWVILGLWIYPIEQTIPLIPLIVGILSEIYRGPWA